jgi:hypothetical protein
MDMVTYVIFVQNFKIQTNVIKMEMGLEMYVMGMDVKVMELKNVMEKIMTVMV